jgi:hypothetical protein
MQKKNHNWSSIFLAHIPKLLWKTKAQKQKMGLLQVGVVFCKMGFLLLQMGVVRMREFREQELQARWKTHNNNKNETPNKYRKTKEWAPGGENKRERIAKKTEGEAEESSQTDGHFLLLANNNHSSGCRPCTANTKHQSRKYKDTQQN